MRLALLAFLLIEFTTVTTAHAGTRTWTGNGADNHFTTVANWAEGVVPDTGDDFIFPGAANQFSLFIDIFPDRIMNSVTFRGGNYTAVGYANTYSLRVEAGTQNLGTNLWKLFGPLFVGEGASLTMWVFGRYSNFTIDGGGTASLTIAGSYGGVINKQGTGTAYLDLQTGGVYSITVNGGRFIIIDQLTTSNGPVTVNSGLFQSINVRPFSVSAVTVTGSNSEIKATNLFTGRLEISNGATLSITSCNSFLWGRPVILTGALLNPLFTSCDGNPSNYVIYNEDSSQVLGNFVNYPEGTTLTVGGRVFKITYRGGDSNDVQFLAAPGVSFDFDGDHRSDIATFRPTDSTWYRQTQAGFAATQWGLASDKLVPADFDGDQKTDFAVFRPTEGRWYILNSLDLTVRYVNFGLPDDLPVPVDFDGDAHADIAIFRPSDGNWWIIRSFLSTTTAAHFGQNGDVPVAGDYDGDSRADLALFRPATGAWLIRRSTGASDLAFQWGLSTDKAVPADFDGDGKTDIAVYRPSESIWYRYLSSTQMMGAVNWGNSTDLPVAADYDGDGRADVAIFRPADDNWWINNTTSGITVQHFGLSEDKPIPGVFVY